jgi:hypothetical protein
MRRDLCGAVMLLLAVPTVARAQSSEFGIRGLGVPGREVSTRSLALGGALGLFDGESSLNPAALSTLTTTTALFTSNGSWSNTTNPAGSLSTRDTRFPQILVGGPIPHHPFALGVSYSMYTDRDFTVVSDGIASPRGVPVIVHDTLSSRGGLDDIRLAGAWMLPKHHLAFGAALHFITGVNRLASRRFWEDTTYTSPSETAELSYAGTGISLGGIWAPTHALELAATWRHDGAVTVSRDSTGTGAVQLPTAEIGTVPLPTTWSAGIHFIPSPRLSISGSVISRDWSVADSSMVAQGAPGARNTFEANAGVEIVRDAKRATKWPLRLGVRYATLPFLLAPDPQPVEYGLSVGTGRRFASDRGGFDITVQHLWRSQGSLYTETATTITFGISVRPGGLTP